MGLASRAAGRGGTSAGALASLFRVALLFFGLWDVQTQTVTNTKPTYIWQTGVYLCMSVILQGLYVGHSLPYSCLI
ncbi:hypothetical protein DPX16_17611 [Anabarilius grahami]|uniref:Uncharacterized protein n=1 Tax=Anabarilius grahami TaxID=495550 RepID=A0A3N0XZG7_ANAGA|nr:hypothetical protein DPX16_17611 [Anabarilius grahami]